MSKLPVDAEKLTGGTDSNLNRRGNSPAAYLASDASRFTTGTAMLVDGGASISRT